MHKQGCTHEALHLCNASFKLTPVSMVATLARVDTVPMVPASQGEAGSRVAAHATARVVHGSSCSTEWVVQCHLMRCQRVRLVDDGVLDFGLVSRLIACGTW